VAASVKVVIKFILMFVPLLILAALSPSIATLVRRGLAGRFAASVIGWYVMTSAIAGLFGLTVASLVFRIPFVSEHEGSAWSHIVSLFSKFGTESSTSAMMPIAAIGVSVIIGLIGAF